MAPRPVCLAAVSEGAGDQMVSYKFDSKEEKLVYHSEIDPLPFLNATIDAASLKKTPFDANKAKMTTNKCN